MVTYLNYCFGNKALMELTDIVLTSHVVHGLIEKLVIQINVRTLQCTRINYFTIRPPSWAVWAWIFICHLYSSWEQ